MEFKVDESVKSKIQKNKYKRREWSIYRKIDTFLYVISIYIPLYLVFFVLNKRTFSLFYGANGAITTSGRILTLVLLVIISYLIAYIPHFIMHTYLLFNSGKDIITRRQECFTIEDDKIIYQYTDLFDNNKKKVFTFKIDDIEKISYIEAIRKIVFMGPCIDETVNKKTNKIIETKHIDTLDLYAYFKPNLLKELEKKDIKIEINFFA